MEPQAWEHAGKAAATLKLQQLFLYRECSLAGMQWMHGYTGYKQKDQYDQIAKMANRMLALYAICHLLVLPGLPFTRLDDTITNTAKERSRLEKLKSMPQELKSTPQELKSMPLELKSTLPKAQEYTGESRDTYKWNLAAYQIQRYKIRVKYTLEFTIIIKYPQVVKICAKSTSTE
ncbi:hypothetical protein BT96DRAFT_941375 [Gymnopus androsaceus JB14]|uniref:Uncharacterized protein n=1 Tax=Gymnopus androsaceus JB14 TaxID=1447944 RepID=A0A6A4HG05_9AGAR|nr:hypothetical protein BT96DRAFT_941375 [Gymnopus androsaceus JB14]